MKNQDDIEEARAALSALVASEAVESVTLNYHGVEYLRTVLSEDGAHALLPRALCVFCGTRPATGLEGDHASHVTKDFAIVGTLCSQCSDHDKALRYQGDPPIADPAERARLVARELRRRGIFACVQGGGVTVCAEDKAFWYHLAFDGVALLGTQAIADRIQREEARRAAAWAGDEEET